MKLSIAFTLFANLFSWMTGVDTHLKSAEDEAQIVLEDAGYTNILLFDADPGACLLYNHATKFTAKIYDNLHHVGHVCTGGPGEDRIFFSPRLAPPVVVPLP